MGVDSPPPPVLIGLIKQFNFFLTITTFRVKKKLTDLIKEKKAEIEEEKRKIQVQVTILVEEAFLIIYEKLKFCRAYGATFTLISPCFFFILHTTRLDIY